MNDHHHSLTLAACPKWLVASVAAGFAALGILITGLIAYGVSLS